MSPPNSVRKSRLPVSPTLRWSPWPWESQLQHSQVFPTTLSRSGPTGTFTFFEMVIGLLALDFTPFQGIILSCVVIDTLPASLLAIDAHTAEGKQNRTGASLLITNTYLAHIPWTPNDFPWQPDLICPGGPGWGIRWEAFIRTAASGPAGLNLRGVGGVAEDAKEHYDSAALMRPCTISAGLFQLGCSWYRGIEMFRVQS